MKEIAGLPRVLLVRMPFGDASRPSIALGLLKAIGHRAGFHVDVLPLNLHFAIRFSGYGFHQTLGSTYDCGLGEWIFSKAVFSDFIPEGCSDASYQDYLERLGVAEEMRQVAHRLRAIVPGFLDYCLSSVDWKRYDLVGFTTTCVELNPSLALARRIKEEFPEILIAFGGAKCEGEMGVQLFNSFNFIDLVFSGEADQSFPSLLEALAERDEKPIPGVYRRDRRDTLEVFREAAPTRMDSLPPPDYSEFFSTIRDLGAQSLIKAGLSVEGSRGCWWGVKSLCTFCGLNGKMLAYRKKSSEQILNEVVDLVEKYRVHRVTFTDNIIDFDYANGVFSELADLGMTLDIFVEIKSNISRDSLALLKRAGVRGLQPGIESVNTHILQLMKKGVTGIQNVQLMRLGAEMNMDVAWNLLFNFPGETVDDYKSVLHTLQSITHLQPPIICSRIRMDRFSPYYDEARGNGGLHVKGENGGADRSGRLAPENGGGARIRIEGPAEHYRHTFNLDDKTLMALAYSFEYANIVEMPDAAHFEEVVSFVDLWQKNFLPQKLIYFAARNSLRIEDTRFNMPARTFTLSRMEKEIYLGCLEAATPERLAKTLKKRFGREPVPDAKGIRGFLDDLEGERLVLREGNLYVSLAVPWDPAYSTQCEQRERARRKRASDEAPPVQQGTPPPKADPLLEQTA